MVENLSNVITPIKSFSLELSVLILILQNGLDEIRKLADFLGVPQNDELFQAIHDKCQFEKMRVDKESPATVYEQFCNKGFRFYRKGILSISFVSLSVQY